VGGPDVMAVFRRDTHLPEISGIIGEINWWESKISHKSSYKYGLHCPYMVVKPSQPVGQLIYVYLTFVCAIQYGSQKPHVAAELLKYD
jgi:hypothetical protein